MNSHQSRRPGPALRRASAALVAAATALAASAPAQAIDATWLGGNGHWNSNRWSTGFFPAGDGHRAIIDGLGLTASFVTLDLNVSLGGLRIGQLDTLSIYREVLTLTGDAVIDGRLSVNGDAIYKGIQLRGNPVRFSGTGTTELGDNTTAFIRSDAGSLMTIAAGHTLTGGGVLGSAAVGYLNGGLLNQGTIIASRSMALNTGDAGFVNQSLVQVDSYLTANAAIDNRGGLFQVAAGATLALVDGTLDGGRLHGGSGSMVWGGRVSNVVIEGTLAVPVGQTLQMSGHIQHVGELIVRGEGFTGNRAVLQLTAGPTTFSGSGDTVLAYGFNSVIRSNDTSPLTLASGHVLRGSGRLGGGGTDALFGGLVNEGTVRVQTDLGISVDTGGAPFDNRGRVEIANNSVLALASGTTLAGGVVQGTGYAQLRGGLRDTTLQGSLVVNQAGNLQLGGQIRNEGTLTVSATNGALFAVVELDRSTTLAGGGQTVLGNEVRNVVFSGAGSRLTVDAGHTLRGAGSLGLAEYSLLRGGLLNRGTLIAEGSSGMRIDTGGDGTVVNRGVMKVAAGSSLTVRGAPLLQDSAAAVLDVAGSLFAPGGVLVAAGRLQGSDRVVGNVVLGAATLSPGNSPGRLVIEGSLQLQDGATLAIDADGLQQGSSYDWLQVSGGTQLDGTLSFAIGYAAAVGDSFRFLSGGTVSGTFDAVLSPGYALTLDYGSNFVTATVAGVVPEPGTWALWLAGMGGIGGLVWRRRALPSPATGGQP